MLLLTGIGLQLVTPQVMRHFIDAARSGAPLQAMLAAGAVYLAAGLAGRGLHYATTYAGLGVAWRASNALRCDLARHCLRLDMPFHKIHTPGEMIERIDGDALELGDFFSQMVVKAAGNALLTVAILALLFRESPTAGLLLSASAISAVAVMAALQNLGARRWAASRRAWAEQSSFLEEHISGSEDIRGIGAETHVLGRFQALAERLTVAARGSRMASALGSGITGEMSAAGYALGLATGAALYTRGDVSSGAAFLIVYYIGMLAEPLAGIQEQAKELQQASGSVGRIHELLALQPRVTGGSGPAIPPGALEVEFSDVSFGYSDGAPRCGEGAHTNDSSGRLARDEPVAPTDGEGYGPVLRDLSFTLAPGRVLGVLGRTGSINLELFAQPDQLRRVRLGGQRDRRDRVGAGRHALGGGSPPADNSIVASDC